MSVAPWEWIGANYIPSDATSSLWWGRCSSFFPQAEQELGGAAALLGITTLRVFLHFSVFKIRGEGFLLDCMDGFLNITSRLGLRPGFVFFDDCYNQAGPVDLDVPCKAVKGKHGGCWVSSPLQVDRRNVSMANLRPYVDAVVRRFRDDERVQFWEIYNEPQPETEFPDTRYEPKGWSYDLRHAAYQWALAQNPRQPVISNYGWKNPDSQVVDEHSYSANMTIATLVSEMRPELGSVFTEAGCRDDWSGLPNLWISWAQQMLAQRGKRSVSGLFLAWEVMVSGMQTRWFWAQPENSTEPSMPWCGWLFPDGTPVSFTEALRLRQLVAALTGGPRGEGAILLYDDLRRPGFDFLRAQADARPRLGPTWPEHRSASFPAACSAGEALVVEVVFRKSMAEALLRVELSGAFSAELDFKSVLLTATSADGSSKGSSDLSTLEGGVSARYWNMLRFVVVGGRALAVYFNPLHPEGPVRPRLHVGLPGPLPAAAAVSVGIAQGPGSGGAAELDYLSALCVPERRFPTAKRPPPAALVV